MTLLGLIAVLVVVGVIMWLINEYIPMEPRIKKILNAAVVIVVVLWLLGLFLGMPIGSIVVPTVR